MLFPLVRISPFRVNKAENVASLHTLERRETRERERERESVILYYVDYLDLDENWSLYS